jgi:hypothetical protein
MVDVASMRVTALEIRRRDEVQAAKIKASIKRYGLVKPILINARYEVIEGHGILEAAKALGILSCCALSSRNSSTSGATLSTPASRWPRSTPS